MDEKGWGMWAVSVPGIAEFIGFIGLNLTTAAKTQFWLYRVSTIFHSLKTLYLLPKERLNAFFASYEIFDYDWDNQHELINKFGPNYYQKMQEKLVDYYSVLSEFQKMSIK